MINENTIIEVPKDLMDKQIKKIVTKSRRGNNVVRHLVDNPLLYIVIDIIN